MLTAMLGFLAYLLIEATIFGVFALSLSRKGNNQYDTPKAVLIIIVIFYIKEGGNLINYFKDTATQVNASRSKLQW